MTDPLGVAILGCAHTPHAWSYARALASSPSTGLVGVYDETPELRGSIARDFQVTPSSDARVLVEASDVEAVVVCSATSEHRSLVELAASLGRHVLCEKPIATTSEDARAMISACRESEVQLHTAFVSRFHPLVQRVRTIVQRGELGELVGIVAGNRGRPPLPPAYPDWITTVGQSGGGALMDHSVHLTDVLRHLSGQEVTRVAAEVGSQLWNCGVDDVALMSLVFDGGLVAHVDSSWSIPVGNPWDYDFYLRLVGTLGSLNVNDVAESLHLVSGKAGNGLRLIPFGVDVDAAMIDAFAASIRAGRVLSPCATGDDGLRALEVALAGYDSAAAASPVLLPG